MSIVRPTSDVTVSGWTQSTGASIFDTVDEAVLDTADFSWSAVSPGELILEINSGVAIPAGPHKVRAHLAISSGSIDVQASLLDGSGVSVGDSAWQAIDATPTTYEFAIQTTADAVRVRFLMTEPGGLLTLDGDVLTLDGDELGLV